MRGDRPLRGLLTRRVVQRLATLTVPRNGNRWFLGGECIGQHPRRLNSWGIRKTVAALSRIFSLSAHVLILSQFITHQRGAEEVSTAAVKRGPLRARVPGAQDQRGCPAIPFSAPTFDKEERLLVPFHNGPSPAQRIMSARAKPVRR
jgi:hypothetical protein